MNKLLCFSALLGIGLFGCSHVTSAPAEPALLREHSPEVIAQLQTAIKTLSGMTNVQLADKVFLRHNQLHIQTGVLNDPEGKLINGHYQTPSKKFLLQLKNGQCQLYYPKTEKSVVLPELSCIKKPSN